MNPKIIFTIGLIFLASIVGVAAPVAQRSPDLSPDQQHAWRLHDQYLDVIVQLDDLEGQRKRLGGDIKHDAQGGVSGGVHVATAGYGSDMAVLNQRITDLTRKASDLEAAWDQKFQGRFGPLKDARESFYDPSTKTKRDKIAFRLTNFPFAPAAPQRTASLPPPQPHPQSLPPAQPEATPSGQTAPTATSGYWRLLETRSVKYVANPGSGVTSCSFNVSDGSITGTQTITGDEGPATWAGECTWSLQSPGGFTRLIPGAVIEVSMTVTDRSVPEKVSGWNHGYVGVAGSIRFDQPYLALGVTHQAAADLVNVSAGWTKSATQKSTWTVPKGPGNSEWGGKAALDANFTFGRFERVYEWTTEPYSPGAAKPATRSASPASSVSGMWTGTWTNSVGEKQTDSLSIEEKADGTVSGTWSGNIRISGRRTSATTLEFNGRTATRNYQVTATLQGGSMTLDYVAHRLDTSGSYRGRSTMTREQ
jgi:hypothetical protein